MGETRFKLGLRAGGKVDQPSATPRLGGHDRSAVPCSVMPFRSLSHDVVQKVVAGAGFEPTRCTTLSVERPDARRPFEIGLLRLRRRPD